MGRASRRPQGIGSGYEHQKGRVPVLGTPLFMNPDPLKTLDVISALLYLQTNPCNIAWDLMVINIQ